MIDDARSVENGQTLTTDVCVVGGGPAGLALARGLDGSGLSVTLLESGGLAPAWRTQSLARAANAGLPYFPLDANRQRCLGGTTRLWAGWCRPFDGIDFEPRAWVPDSGWPFGFAELAPWYEAAYEILGVEDGDFELSSWERRLGARRAGVDGDRFASRLFRLADPGAATASAAAMLRASGNVRALLHATVTNLDAGESCSRVDELEVQTLERTTFRVRARVCVLAGGGIENARLLLASNRIAPGGLGNAFDLVGRYFMEHIVFEDGTIALDDPSSVPASLYLRPSSGTVARLFPTAETQREERILNACTQLLPLYRNPADSVLRRLRAGIVNAYASSVARQRWMAYGLSRFVGPGLAHAYRRGLDQYSSADAAEVRLMHVMEQAPNRDSRVTLGHDRDALGMRRAKLEWRTTALDERSAEAMCRLVGAAFAAARLGRASDAGASRLPHWPPPPLQGLRGHHMGTTRMHVDPRHGVVDASCRVHGIDNLYVAGSSVFPTSGAGVPTTTIVALALRLADHLLRTLRS